MRTRDGRTERHPDQRVQHAVWLVFEKFTEFGDVRQSVLWFRQQEISLPGNDRDPAWGERVKWRCPTYSAALRILRNPFYTGADAFGRTNRQTTLVKGVARTRRLPRSDRADWITLIRGHHEPDIAWDVFTRMALSVNMSESVP